ncbi:hypothetical protein LEP1GSC171_1292 [Leptospira santarosai str. HAI1380]|nr:hypothetical protein LEP1GSC171_1292 [Leptospira santarosai str. HAI1380]
MEGWFLILLLIPTLLFSESSVSDDCTFKGRKSYGRIILVSSIRIFAFKSILLSVYLQFSSIYEKRSTL